MSADSAEEQTVQSGGPRHAGVWVRVVANLLDLVIMGAPVLLLVSLIVDAESEAKGSAVSLADFYNAGTLIQAALLGIVTVVLWVNWDGRTPGKKLAKIKIVSYPGYSAFSYGTATLRTVLSLTGVLTLGLLYLVMAIMIGVRSDKRGFHDIAAGTCVIHDE